MLSANLFDQGRGTTVNTDLPFIELWLWFTSQSCSLCCLQAVKSYGCGFRVRIWPSDDIASQSFRDCFSQIRSSSIPLDWKVSKMQIMCFQPSTASNICARRVDPHRPVFATIITWKKSLRFEIMQRKLREHSIMFFYTFMSCVGRESASWVKVSMSMVTRWVASLYWVMYKNGPWSEL